MNENGQNNNVNNESNNNSSNNNENAMNDNVNNESVNNSNNSNSDSCSANNGKKEGPLNRWKNTTKTQAKRMGIKSTYSYGDGSLAVTKFGKGNKAEVVLSAPNAGVDVPTPSFYDPIKFNSIDNLIDVERGELNSILANPAFNEGFSQDARSDYLKLKGVLEEEFFGNQFPKDTVRIQIIYNLLDVLKIFGVYVNDVIYSVNNLQPEPTDVVGLSMSKGKMQKALANMSPFFGFFGDAFKISQKAKGRNAESINKQRQEEADEFNAQVLRVLGAIRQMTAHFKDADKMFAKIEQIEKDLKEMTNESKKISISCWKVVESAYEKRIKDVNENFLKNSCVNLGIIFDLLGAYDDDKKAKITQEYYCFSILKQGKNLGLNMKKLRETMLDAYCPYIKGEEHDSYRQKLYVVTDFLLFKTLNGSEMLDEMVEQLRVTSDDEEKEALYAQFAEKVWPELEKSLTSFYSMFSEGFPAFTSVTIPEAWLGKVALRVDNGLPFVMLLSFLCNFLEAKEINELLTAFINKFENIQAMIDVQQKLKDNIAFSAKYDSFNKHGGRVAGEIAKQLRAIVSIGKMKPDLEGAKRLLYISAIKTLGIPDDSKYVTEEWLKENVLLSAEEKKNKNRVKSVNPFRNFIANNVIESRPFLYLVRYTKPETVRAIMTNPKIVRYALSRLPESQIELYYKRASNVKDDALDAQEDRVSLDEKLNALTKVLTGLSFKDVLEKRADILKEVENRPKAIERLKAQIGLYLTAAYLVVKNLVKTNARYYIAFAAFDRDYEMLKQKDLEKVKKNVITFEYFDDKGEVQEDANEIFAPTEYYLDRDDEIKYVPENGVFDKEACHRYFDEHKAHFTRKWRDIFRNKEIPGAKEVNEIGYLGVFVRNTAAHLNAMTELKTYINDFRCGSDAPMKSYFELYHYIVQRLALDWNKRPLCKQGQELDLEQYREFIETNGLPSNELIHICYCSLGYNLPRYKNLTIAALFDSESVDGQARAKRLSGGSGK
ncbi:MAG: type VI-D CRISPR-associated RNA-guided ribonuclease Cas13d [Thermoguttaceae bacterium]|nr:type VI-D CRISPR-associated RNA-guided ribonuclease Cas13d [Thermoguttaceae bacterium]